MIKQICGMGIPQIRNSALNLCAIAMITVACGVFNASVHGEIHGWGDIAKAISDGFLYGVVTAFGWLGMRSPLAKYVGHLLQQEGTTTTVEPSGAVTIKQESITIASAEPTEAKDGHAS